MADHRRDDLGLRRALQDRLLPLLVGTMAFLAAIALAGTVAASALARHWQGGAESVLTVQVPPGGDAGAVLALLRAVPGIGQIRRLDDAQLADLLRPWLGAQPGQLGLPLPQVIDARIAPPAPDLQALAGQLAQAVPGTMIDSGTAWASRLAVLARSLQACAGLMLLLVAGLAAAMVTVATRAGLAMRRDTIAIIHGLGATDFTIARRFAARVAWLAGIGAAAGVALAVPVLVVLALLVRPFAVDRVGSAPFLIALPPPIWVGLALLPVVAALLGWATAFNTVREWLQDLA